MDLNMKTPDLLDSYEHEFQPNNNRQLAKCRSASKKSKSCWREIERIKEKRALLREVHEFNGNDSLGALEAAFL